MRPLQREFLRCRRSDEYEEHQGESLASLIAVMRARASSASVRSAWQRTETTSGRTVCRRGDRLAGTVCSDEFNFVVDVVIQECTFLRTTIHPNTDNHDTHMYR